jgi:hypothetical protein
MGEEDDIEVLPTEASLSTLPWAGGTSFLDKPGLKYPEAPFGADLIDPAVG